MFDGDGWPDRIELRRRRSAEEEVVNLGGRVMQIRTGKYFNWMQLLPGDYFLIALILTIESSRQ